MWIINYTKVKVISFITDFRVNRIVVDSNMKIQLELRESDVSPCEQYRLREMAWTKMKYEN
jgi:hypothetical protein